MYNIDNIFFHGMVNCTNYTLVKLTFSIYSSIALIYSATNISDLFGY